MSVAKKVAGNTAFLIVGRALAILVQLVIVGLLARYLGAAGYGKYAFAFAYLSFFEVLANAGLDSILVREISRDHSKSAQLIGQGITIRFFISLLSVALAAVIISLLGYPQDTTAAVYVLSLTVVFTALRTPEIIFQVLLKSHYIAALNLFTKLLTLSLVFFAIAKGAGLVFIVWMVTAATLAHFLAIVIFARRFVMPKLSLDLRLIRWILKESWPVTLTSVLIAVYFRIDTIMLSLMKGDAAVGYYSAAYSIMATLIFIPGAYAASVFPVMSRYFKSSTGSLIKVFKRSFKYLFTLALPIVVGGCILSGDIIIYIFGGQFYASIDVFRILIFALGIIFMANLASSSLTAVNRQKINLWLVIANVGLNISLNVILIPRFSYIGASIATVFTEALGCSLAFFLIIRFFRLSVFSKRYLSIIKPFLAAAAMAAVIYSWPLHFLVRIPLGALIYVSALLLLRWFDNVDFLLLKEILKIKT